MTRLAVPDVALRESLADTVADFGGTAMDGSGVWHFDDGRLDASPAGVGHLVRTLRGYADRSTPVPDGMVHCDYLWVTDDEAGGVIGFLALRHELNDFLLEQGGHVGYSIRPGRRREGHASRALALAVPRAKELGLDRVLVTCDEDNEASRRTIERNGGVYEDSRKGKRRYWIDTRVTPGGGRAASS